MLRQFSLRTLMLAGIAAAAGLILPGCGIKGPLRPAPKATPAAAPSPPPPIDNPATPPPTTSPALPPPPTPPERKP